MQRGSDGIASSNAAMPSPPKCEWAKVKVWEENEWAIELKPRQFHRSIINLLLVHSNKTHVNNLNLFINDVSLTTIKLIKNTTTNK